MMRSGPAKAIHTLILSSVVLWGCGNGVTKFTGDALTDTDGVDISTDTVGDTPPLPCVTDADCDDGEMCNGEEYCSLDGCVASAWPPEGSDCETSAGVGGTCRSQRCVPVTCGDSLLDAGEECDDGNLASDDGCEFDCTFSCHEDAECLTDEACMASTCIEGGTGRICASSAVDGPCDDGDPCTDGDFCADGVCVPGTAVCLCTTDDDCGAYDDDDLCNGVMICDDGVCVPDPGSVVDCDAPPPGACFTVACNPATGTCETSPVDDGTSCEDGNLCTGPDTCHGGACTSGPEMGCDSSDPCVDAYCDPDEGCVGEVMVGAPCNDGNACTVEETCNVEGDCTSEIALDCDDSDRCTDDLCDVSTGCYHTANEAPCNDGDPCTTGDHCYMGHCGGDELPTAYGDWDGDGFGNSWDTVCTEALPEGYSWENGDCCDLDPEIYPGQPHWFTESYICDDIGMPDFDYDCSGVWETRYNDLGECVTSSGGTCVVRAGWMPSPTGTRVPGCGEEGSWLAACGHTTMGCAPSAVEVLVQECH